MHKLQEVSTGPFLLTGSQVPSPPTGRGKGCCLPNLIMLEFLGLLLRGHSRLQYKLSRGK